MRGFIWPPQVGQPGMTPEECANLAEQIELLQQYNRWVVLKLVAGKSPRRWVIRDANHLQELVENLAQKEPYGVKAYRVHLDDDFEWPADCQPAEGDIFGQMFGSIRVIIAALKAQVVEVTIPSKGIILWIQQAFDKPEMVYKAAAEKVKERRKASQCAETSAPPLGKRGRRVTSSEPNPNSEETS